MAEIPELSMGVITPSNTSLTCLAVRSSVFWLCNRLVGMKSNLQLIQGEMRKLPQAFRLVLPFTPEHQPCDRSCTQGYAARDGRAVSGSAGGDSRTLPELPGEALCCAAGVGEALLGRAATGLV